MMAVVAAAASNADNLHRSYTQERFDDEGFEGGAFLLLACDSARPSPWGYVYV